VIREDAGLLSNIEDEEMEKNEISYAIRRLLRRELDDCERAIKNDDKRRALSELEDAMKKLKRLAAAAA
jgi:hypothetical protein